MGLQTGAIYTLTGPNGTRAVFNDPADLDFVGFLNADGGISFGSEVRESADSQVERDGGLHGSFYAGRMPIVLQGWIPYDEPYSIVNDRIDRFYAATNALRADAVLRWTEDGSPERRLLLRRQQTPRVGGRLPKTFQVGLVSAAHVAESAALQQQVIVAGATGYLGVASPMKSPLASIIAGGGQQFVVNQGTELAYPILTIDGPITNPRILNNTTGEELRLTYTLAGGEYLVIDMRQRTVVLNGNPAASRYSAVEFPASRWWGLIDGNNDIRLNAAAAGGGAQCTVAWRHAWGY